MLDRKWVDTSARVDDHSSPNGSVSAIGGSGAAGRCYETSTAGSDVSSTPRELPPVALMTANDISHGGIERTAASGASPTEMLGSLIRNQVGRELLAVEELLEKALASRYQEVHALAGRAAAMGGKRLRPMLVLLFHQASRSDGTAVPDSRVAADAVRAAAAVELVHAASLVHDDVMDQAAERRHQPTISHACGNRQAVLLGDFLFTRAYAVAASCSRAVVARRIAAAATELCEGELRQQASAGQWKLSFKEYRSILHQKTGALTGVSCRLGCSVVGAAAARLQAAQRFGASLGLAFQIFDDWLDYWGEDQRVGKTLGTDLGQLKPTLPLMRLLRTCSRSDRRRLIELLERKDLAAFEEIRAALDHSDARSYTLESARRCVERAKQQLTPFAESPALDCVRAIADFSVQRSY
jgi:octaprenyl-diphosphate synthase